MVFGILSSVFEPPLYIYFYEKCVFIKKEKFIFREAQGDIVPTTQRQKKQKQLEVECQLLLPLHRGPTRDL